MVTKKKKTQSSEEEEYFILLFKGAKKNWALVHDIIVSRRLEFLNSTCYDEMKTFETIAIIIVFGFYWRSRSSPSADLDLCFLLKPGKKPYTRHHVYTIIYRSCVYIIIYFVYRLLWHIRNLNGIVYTIQYIKVVAYVLYILYFIYYINDCSTIYYHISAALYCGRCSVLFIKHL